MKSEEIQETLKEHGYFGNLEIALAIKAATLLNKPILVEGPPGVGKKPNWQKRLLLSHDRSYFVYSVLQK
ncbi:hypothetical protein GCM10020331_046490 [Ectobacillus funiculus]